MTTRYETSQIEFVEFEMLRPHLQDIPDAVIPDGYRIRLFQAGDEANWCRIEQAVDEFTTFDRARRQFDKEFGPYPDDMASRSFILETDAGEAIGTTTAWFGDFKGETIGRIHWVAIVPEHQGRGLSKPLLATALRRLASDHDRAFLSTQTTSYRAAGLYASFGFEPVIETESDRKAWDIVQSLLAG